MGQPPIRLVGASCRCQASQNDEQSVHTIASVMSAISTACGYYTTPPCNGEINARSTMSRIPTIAIHPQHCDLRHIRHVATGPRVRSMPSRRFNRSPQFRHDRAVPHTVAPVAKEFFKRRGAAVLVHRLLPIDEMRFPVAVGSGRDTIARTVTMQRDMKVGMALGVAIVGIVGALFFRREPEHKQDDVPPPLQETEQLDRAIAEKPHTPYLQGLEEFAVAPAPPPAAAQSKATPKPRGDNYKVPGFLTDDDEAEQRLIGQRPAAAPDPIPAREAGKDPVRAVAREPRPAVAPPPAHNAEWEPVEQANRRKAEPEQGSSVRPATQSRTHVIQSGDTLSGIAAKYLGSSARYHEIYEANRDVLRTPHDLPNGATLRIPDGSHKETPAILTNGGPKPPSREADLPRDPDAGRSGPATSSEAGETKIRFAPVGRSPFSAGRTTAPSASTKTQSEKKSPRLDLEDDADDFSKP
jgi:nucleoid-associated protein YgaU